MRIVVFFDLPIDTAAEQKDYRAFRRFLLKSGFVMMQESVYSKIVLNYTAAEAVMENIRRNRTARGLIQMLVVTERQFSRMEIVVGDPPREVVADDSKLVIL